MSDVTQILAELEQGDDNAAAELFPLVYAELRRLAAHLLAGDKPGQTLDPTGLVHEAYLRLFGNRCESSSGLTWNDRAHFFRVSAEIMRRILVDKARRKARIKHGGLWRRVNADDIADVSCDERLLALDEALTRLAAEDETAARVVELHHFAGLSHDLVAEALGITVYQARQHWNYARAWLQEACANHPA
jgi:RNA polymerase sigma factor (TIGR02999 family)